MAYGYNAVEATVHGYLNNNNNNNNKNNYKNPRDLSGKEEKEEEEEEEEEDDDDEDGLSHKRTRSEKWWCSLPSRPPAIARCAARIGAACYIQ